jgi:aspartate/methionine/tyrosine aminotransferase
MFGKKKSMVEAAAIHESVVQDEMDTLNRLAQQAIEELQDAENRGAPQAELDELTQKVNDAMQRQEDLLTSMEDQ